MGWVKDGIRFPDRMKRFVLPRPSTTEHDVLRFLSNEMPDALEKVLKKIINDARPELANCLIVAMTMNYEYARWEVLVSDDSLPPVESGCMIECQQL